MVNVEYPSSSECRGASRSGKGSAAQKDVRVQIFSFETDRGRARAGEEGERHHQEPGAGNGEVSSDDFHWWKCPGTDSFFLKKRLAAELAHEEEKKKQLKAERHQRDKEIILTQIEERQKLREQEKRENKEHEQREMARALRLKEQEQEEIRLQKEREKEARERLIIENEKEKRIKQEILRKQQDEERRMQEEYE